MKPPEDFSMSHAPDEDRSETAPDVDDGDRDVVTIPRAELEALRSTAAGRDLAATADDATSRREETLARELSARDAKVTDLETAYRRAICDRELATALAGRPLVAGAAAQLIKLWRDDFDAYEESGEYRVSARDGRTASRWVDDRLVGPEFAHFCIPSSRGGVGAKGLSQAGAADGTSSPGARTLGEAVVTRWRESLTSQPGPAQGQAGWGRRR